ncbi:MAG: hypothetical protein WC716_16865 [Chitinophagaceae bacterium]|jgi:hypothetical protein
MKKPAPKKSAARKKTATKKVPTLFLVVRSVTVTPDNANRKKETSRKLKNPKNHKLQWYGIERKKKNAVIRTRMEYIPVTEDMMRANKVPDLIEQSMERQAAAFIKGKANQLSQSAQFVKGAFVNKHTGRMRANAKVGKQIQAVSVAKVVKKGRGKKKTLFKYSKKTIKMKLHNAIVRCLNDVPKMMEYGLITASKGRKKKKSHKKKNTLQTDRQEKIEAEE